MNDNKNIQIAINNDSICFTLTNVDFNSNIENTNIITDSELTFSKNYIKDNSKILSLFISELCKEKNIYRASIETNNLAYIICPLLNKNPYITAVCIRENTILPFSLYEKLIENKNLNYIEAYNIPTYMIELLDKLNIRCESRTEVFYVSHFMQSNNLTNYSKIFYKMNVRIDKPLTHDDLEDFLAFANINKYLKTIHLDSYNKDDLEDIINILMENNIKNIKILIYDNIKNYKTIEVLKKINHTLKRKKKKIKIELVYSKEYLKDNIFTQIAINTLKICGVFIILLVVGIMSYITVSNYIALKQDIKTKEYIQDIINEKKDEVVTPSSNEQKVINKYILPVLSINPDVVGWIKINNTEIDYPVVQTYDNEYYLQKNLYKENDQNGWIFMDYRNTTNELDKNTIIYGHNMYYSKVMFGSLVNATKKEWYSNKDNQIINYDTIYSSNKYQIFAVYIVPKTSDYLKTYFASDIEFMNFIKMLKDRSINNFNVEVKPTDKIITLSTCTNYSNRLVVHAKLIEET